MFPQAESTPVDIANVWPNPGRFFPDMRPELADILDMVSHRKDLDEYRPNQHGATRRRSPCDDGVPGETEIGRENQCTRKLWNMFLPRAPESYPMVRRRPCLDGVTDMT